MTRIRKALGALVIALGLAGGSFLGFARAQQPADPPKTTPQQMKSVEDLSSVFREVGQAVEPAVVKIDVRKTIKNPHGNMQGIPDELRRFFRGRGMPEIPAPGDEDNGDNSDGGDGGFETIGTGSGVIMEVDGSTVYVVTNNHVAGGAEELDITLADGRTIKKATLVGTDPKTDLALVKMTADNVKTTAKWGDSGTVQKGDFVLAFGSPFGYVGSMTHGIVSALNRDIGILARQQGYESFIQVDAPINPGNSGGPLVNLKGEIIGINTAIASRSGGFQGIGFAIPSNQAKFVYAQLKQHGKVIRGYLGVSIASVDDPRVRDLARSFGYEETKGVLVQEVVGSSPAAGKLKEGDIITKINGQEVRDVTQLRNMVASQAPKSEITLNVFRDGKNQDVKLTLGQQPENMSLARRGGGGGGEAAGEETGTGKVGLRLGDITTDLAQKFSLPDDLKKGAVVTNLDPKSVAAKQGMRLGDVITRVGGQAVNSAAEARDALGKADLKKGVRLYVVSADGSRFVFLKSDE